MSAAIAIREPGERQPAPERDEGVAGGTEVLFDPGAEGDEVARTLDAAWAVVSEVPDPELPMLTLADLGILGELGLDGNRVVVSLVPTYSGCPALTEMARDVARRLAGAGFVADVRYVLSPPWTTDRITAAGRAKLAAAGIAPPRPVAAGSGGPVPVHLGVQADSKALACPRCGSDDTVRTAAFGATACRALYRCRTCGEPFEHVKEI